MKKLKKNFAKSGKDLATKEPRRPSENRGKLGRLGVSGNPTAAPSITSDVPIFHLLDKCLYCITLYTNDTMLDS